MSGSGEPPSGRWGHPRPEAGRGFLGPIEAAGDGETPPHPAPAPPGPTRRQLLLVAALLLAAGALVVAHHHGVVPTQAANSPPPYPSLVARFRYGGPLREAAPGGHEFTLKVVATATGPLPYDIVQVRQDYPGITISVDGAALPRTVASGQRAELSVVYHVTDCAAAPRDAGMPLLNVTLRNVRAIQTLSQILGDSYARDLSRNLHITCPDAAIRTPMPASPDPDTSVR